MRFLLVCVLGLCAVPLRAQSTDTVRTTADSLRVSAPATRDTLARPRGAVALEEVRVRGTRQQGYVAPRTSSATRTDTPLLDVPQSVSVVTRDLIADQSMRGMADVVRYIPGVTMGQGEGHRDQPVIRGNASTADFFVDGVRDDVQYLRDMYNVERIEALKGPNAMIFGRGGGGGVLNRVTKEADRAAHRELGAVLGAFAERRATLDLGMPASPSLFTRLNAMLERSESFRDEVGLTRWGVNPTLTLSGARSTVRASYEHFDDRRTVDRGIPSYRGGPAPTDVATFFGNPDVNHAFARVDAGRVAVERAIAPAVTIRNQTRYAMYDKFYQNVVPGAVNADATQVTLSAYNNATRRANLFNQTDLVLGGGLGRTWHTFLIGAELGRQATDNRRNTGYFSSTATSTTVSFAEPTVSIPVSFRPSATDADHAVTADVGALYAQDQVALSPRWQAIVGARAERFALRLHDRRGQKVLRRTDVMLSPRAGLVFKPREPVSLYASVGVSALPSAGDQFSSLNATTQALRPERFVNYETGAKWAPTSALTVSTALYRLDRGNTQARDPNDPSRIVQTGSQRTTGVELEVLGSPLAFWQIAGGAAAQRARIVSTTTAAKAGATPPLVPERTLSLWNRLDLTAGIGVALGAIHQGRSWAAVDNTVTLPAFTRLDAALFVSLPAGLRAQLNVENLGDVRYYPTSQGNNNILPGSPRSWRMMISTGH